MQSVLALMRNVQLSTERGLEGGGGLRLPLGGQVTVRGVARQLVLDLRSFAWSGARLLRLSLCRWARMWRCATERWGGGGWGLYGMGRQERGADVPGAFVL